MNAQRENQHLVFVYGTLRAGQENHSLLKDAMLIDADAWAHGIMYNTTLGYPAVYDDFENFVYGELYQVSDSELQVLDELEDYHGDSQYNEYMRVKKDIYTKQGIQEGYVYLYNLPVTTEMHRIDTGDWLLQEESQDSHEESNDWLKENRKRFLIRTIAVVLSFVLLFSVVGPWFRIFAIPSLDLLSTSRELGKDPMIQLWKKSIVTVNTSTGKGTGFNIHSSGVIITNAHVVDGAKSAYVGFDTGKIYDGSIRQTFSDIDIAILDIEGKDLPALTLALSSNLKIHDKVIIIGNPLGFFQIVMEGTFLGISKIDNWEKPILVFNSPIVKGTSGSPVINHDGQVVGVIFAHIRDKQANGKEVIYGLAVPIDYLNEQEISSYMSNIDNN
ncbi:hypothetical protein BHU72_08590 [Desulfuribacillus stibiiarsenatis]|uniref:Gamma-glutamylcyclotransferase AIG2-like domain-containing protein n=1 Tax=Desulfuribacillus stibiiarsenatis TaxID=1390249 RepID=A0A1E5L337_9FIRM|nr:trypsin-like peptidase domain-containing protein [Desulfuribacillus stibiiarsenatis]OEH84555.1 hypothetical protein BHU72_08590 [Desulfuribacillus stibiiarsenatis]